MSRAGLPGEAMKEGHGGGMEQHSAGWLAGSAD